MKQSIKLTTIDKLITSIRALALPGDTRVLINGCDGIIIVAGRNPARHYRDGKPVKMSLVVTGHNYVIKDDYLIHVSTNRAKR